jgi:hypothetical protein
VETSKDVSDGFYATAFRFGGGDPLWLPKKRMSGSSAAAPKFTFAGPDPAILLAEKHVFRTMRDVGRLLVRHLYVIDTVE